jgi:hypothetical protein
MDANLRATHDFLGKHEWVDLNKKQRLKVTAMIKGPGDYGKFEFEWEHILRECDIQMCECGALRVRKFDQEVRLDE